MNAIAASESFTIERAGLLDLWPIRCVERAAFHNDAYDLLTIVQLLLSPQTVCLKAVADGRVAAFVAAESHKREGCGWIITIGVHPDAQGRGIGAALLRAAEHALGVSCIKLTVRRSNARAIALYERCGYRWLNTYHRYYHDGEDGLVMEKRI